MATKFVTAIAKGTDSEKTGADVARKAMDKLESSKVDFSLVFISAKYDYAQALKGVRSVIGDALLLGSSSSGEFTESSVEKESIAICLISTDSHKFFTGIGQGLKADENATIIQAAAQFPKTVEGFPHLSAIVLHDGLVGKGEETALAGSHVLGCKLAGGSAGDDLNMKTTYTFCGDKVKSDSVSLGLIASKQPVVVAVQHGHMPISPALTVTKAKDNIVYELDGKPALEVWKKHAQADALKNFNIKVDELKAGTKEFSDFMTRYEAGLYVGKGEYKIRWPGLTTDTSGPMVFACAMPKGTVLRVMGSPKDNQIASAKRAAEIAKTAAKGMKLAGCLVFDCVVRAIILGDEFAKAIKAIHETLEVPLLGFETYGELCMEIGQMSGYHNTTTVIMLIPD